MRRKINWGVLGAAAIAVQRTMPALKEASSAVLLALASRDMNKGRAVAESLAVSRIYGSYDDLLADSEIDAVYVPLPNRLHFEWSVRSLEAGKNVLCEKPLCMSADEIRRLCVVRDKSRLHIEEGFAYRNHPQWTKVAELLNAGAIGKVRSVHATMAKQFLDPADIRNDPDAGGGALYDLGSYTINACNLIFGRAPIRVVAAIDRDPVFRIDRLSSALLDYGDQHAAITVSTQGGTGAWGSHQQMSVLGEKGWLRFEFPFAHARPTACRLEFGDETSVGAFPTRTFDFAAVNQYVLQVERFSRLLLGESVSTWPIEDSLDTLRTLEAIFESARTGGWQALD
jgi:predicted dehydrogenase